MQNLNITILALHLGYGGIEQFISNMANMLSKDNKVEIISVYKLYEKPVFYINDNVKISYLLENLKPNRYELKECIKNRKILEFIKQACVSLKILYLKNNKMKKCIRKLNSDIIISTRIEHNKLVSKYANKLIKKIATEHNYNEINKAYTKRLINSCKNINYLVIASKELANKYKILMNNKKCKILNIPLCLDYIPERTSELKEKQLTYIGRLSEEKGIIDLIEVFNIVNKKDENIILNIIGDGNKKSDVIAKIKEYGLEKKVILHGFKNKKDIEKILLKTSVAINTSFTESFGLAILESFSYGIPAVVFSSAEGLKEFIVNKENGYIIEGRNWNNMAYKITELMNNSDKRKKFGINARNKSLCYSIDKIKKNWDKLIN